MEKQIDIDKLQDGESIPVNAITRELLRILKDTKSPDPYAKLRAAELLMNYVNNESK